MNRQLLRFLSTYILVYFRVAENYSIHLSKILYYWHSFRFCETHLLHIKLFVVKGGPEPSNFEDLCLVNVSVKYFSKLCFGTSKNQLN